MAIVTTEVGGQRQFVQYHPTSARLPPGQRVNRQPSPSRCLCRQLTIAPSNQTHSPLATGRRASSSHALAMRGALAPVEPCIFFSAFIRCACSASKVAVKYDVLVDRGSVFIIGKRLRWAGLFIFGIRGRKLAVCIFDFLLPRLFLPPGKSVMWLRLDAARH